MNRIPFIFLIWLFCFHPAHAQSFLCIAEKLTGFSYNKQTQTWNNSTFDTSTMKWIIRRPTRPEMDAITPNSDAPFFVIEKFGSGGIVYGFCDPNNKSSYVNCTTLDGRFRFNLATSRYIATHDQGFIESRSELFQNEGDITPGIEIGRCNKIN